MYDVLTIGETMLRFTPIEGLRWEQADRFDLHIGGSESNTAVGLARLGHSVAWVSRLTNNAFGRKIAGTLSRHGVDTGHVVWTDQDRIGTYYFEPGVAPRENQVLYDRERSSFTRFDAQMLPAQVLMPGFARLLHVTGISLALGKTSQQLIRRCVEAMDTRSGLVSFDVNYRAKLWSASEASAVCNEVFDSADVVFLPLRDARRLWSVDVSDKQLADDPAHAASLALDQFQRCCSADCIVMTLGQCGAAAWVDGQHYYADTLPAPAIGRLGGGDAFVAGFLSALLHDMDTMDALRWGNAAARLKYSISGDLPIFTRQEVQSLLTPTTTAGENFR
jgi:2-dehydro-3-deoxygluconokinase